MYIDCEGYIEISFFFCFDMTTMREAKVQKVNKNLFREVFLFIFFWLFILMRLYFETF